MNNVAYYKHWEKYNADKAKADELKGILHELIVDIKPDVMLYKRALAMKLITLEEYNLLREMEG